MDKYETPEDIKNGLLVLEVDPRSDAAEKGIARGSIIVSVQQKKVITIDDLISQVSEAKLKERSVVLLGIQFSGELRMVAIRIMQD
jgi:serine protease Do